VLKPVSVRITEVVRETPSITTLYFDRVFPSHPGQFAMVWLRGVDEVPMALSSKNAITVQRVGDATAGLSGLEVGDSVGVRAPLGRGFNLVEGNILLVAGGVGSAPLAPLAELASQRGCCVTTLLGARTGEELLFRERFERVGVVKVSTDDGSVGFRGFVSELFEREDLLDYQQVYLCGPELMMAACFDVLRRVGLVSCAQFSLHRYFKCGIGVCGACCIDPGGLRVCRDGPVFRGDLLLGGEFGRYRRDECGIKIKI
jgi:dihydroorotate dehydrogenase electron transfer subunit